MLIVQKKWCTRRKIIKIEKIKGYKSKEASNNTTSAPLTPCQNLTGSRSIKGKLGWVLMEESLVQSAEMNSE